MPWLKELDYSIADLTQFVPFALDSNLVFEELDLVPDPILVSLLSSLREQLFKFTVKN